MNNTPPIKLTLPEAAFISKLADLAALGAHFITDYGEMTPVTQVEQMDHAEPVIAGSGNYAIHTRWGQNIHLRHDAICTQPSQRAYIYLLNATVEETLLIALSDDGSTAPPRLAVSHIYPDASTLHLAIAQALYNNELEASNWNDLLGEHPQFINTVPGVRFFHYVRQGIYAVPGNERI